jgi:L-ribulose-5-phosphate 3-epimerase
LKRGVYVGCFPTDMGLEDRLVLAAEAGFDTIEVRGDEELIDSDDKLRALAELSGRTLPISSIMPTVGWRPSLTSADHGDRSRAIDILRRTIRAARILGADSVLVVPGVVNEQVSYQAAWDRSQEALRGLALTAEECGVYLCIENVWNKFLLSPLEMGRCIDEVNHPKVRAYFDVGNVLAFGFPEQWIDLLGDRIKKVHVKDFKVSVGNINGFVQLLDGDVNWPAVVAALRKIGYDGPLTAEVAPYRHLSSKGIFDLSSSIGAIIEL